MANRMAGLFLMMSLLAGNAVAVDWVGYQVADLVRAIGYPAQTTVAPSGNALHIYILKDNQYKAADFSHRTRSGNLGYTIPGQLYHWWCHGYFEVDQQGIIVNTGYRGNSCR
jgi:hypothetical protein